MGPIFLVLLVAAVLTGFATGHLEALSQASIDSATQAFNIALGLVGMMSLWLGLVEVVRRGGLMESLARGLAPIFRRLFPEVPDGHPALSAMTLNIAANMLGLTNAATPFGVDAMRKLDTLNGAKGTATNAMALFLAINTSGVALLPTGAIAVRAKLGSHDPAGIIATTLLATSCSTATAIIAALLATRLAWVRRTAPPAISETGRPAGALAQVEALAFVGAPAHAGAHAAAGAAPVSVRWNRSRSVAALVIVVAAVMCAAVGVMRVVGQQGTASGLRAALSFLPLPALMLAAVLYGWARGVPVYEALVEGAKDGFQVAIRITPYMVAILVVVGMFRASGALEAVTSVLAGLVAPLGFPPEALPMALIRPLSGSGALGVMTETLQHYGPDSFIGYLVSTLQGSFETTFYVLAVYGGTVGLKRTRHIVPVCLIGDLAGVIGATLACHLLIAVP